MLENPIPHIVIFAIFLFFAGTIIAFGCCAGSEFKKFAVLWKSKKVKASEHFSVNEMYFAFYFGNVDEDLRPYRKRYWKRSLGGIATLLIFFVLLFSVSPNAWKM